jgi:pre-mRNA-processing factor 17
LFCFSSAALRYDTRSGALSLVYERHLQAVNTITFFDAGRRFISSSDDKTLRYWEFGTPVEIKVCIHSYLL